MTGTDRQTVEHQSHAAARTAAGQVSKSGNEFTDGVLSGFEWKTADITYAFPDAANDYSYGPEKNKNFHVVSSEIEIAVRRILDAESDGVIANDGFCVEGLTNLNISEGADDRTAVLRYAESSEANPTAYANYPGNASVGGDVWLGRTKTDSFYPDAEIGSYEFAVMMHETGHALGLKHPHKAESYDKIKTELHGRYDSHEYSVMTYHSYAGVHHSFLTNEISSYPQTFMMLDIAALQHMYGADFSTNNGATVYKWAPDSGNTLVNGAVGIEPNVNGSAVNRIFATIWDGGGEDTYDLSDYDDRVVVDLRPGKSSLFSQSQLADLGNFDGPGQHMASGNIYNALLYRGKMESLIENAVGGGGGDTLTGNAADNDLTGNGGDDTFVFRKNSNHDTITDFGIGADVINLRSFDIQNFMKLLGKMSDGLGGVAIDFGKGDLLLIEGETVATLDVGDFML
ncbi:M10 family metallopeptidase [Rhizobium sp. TH2]|uniref:M10 family metallopeptidase n=1 Tax=Rhizobium sp. TH2 TaxID=2775403 RepID=UPI00215875D5|nr:M10 family metallopeptidase [Rhizobium sp. TH2]UVC10884.1 M10 family metallopeptidase [Rhizobium sp. TH2]